MRCEGFVGLNAQQCAQMRAVQLLFPGARLRPHFALAAYAAVSDVWLGDLREVRPSRFGIKPSRDSESYPHRAFGIRDCLVQNRLWNRGAEEDLAAPRQID